MDKLICHVYFNHTTMELFIVPEYLVVLLQRRIFTINKWKYRVVICLTKCHSKLTQLHAASQNNICACWF